MTPTGTRSRTLCRIARTAIPALVATVALGACSSSSSAKSGDKSGSVSVGILQLSQATLLDGIVSGFESQLRKDLAPRRVSFDVHNAQGDNSLIQSIAQQLHESSDELFAVAGTPGIIALAQLEKRRPIIGLAMTDPVQAKVAKSEAASGTNVTGSLGFIPPSQILNQVLQIHPATKTIGTIYDPGNAASQIWVTSFKAAIAAKPGLSLIQSTISGPGDIAAAAQSLRGRADTWVIPPDTTVAAGLPAVGSAALSAKAPLFVTAGDPQTAGVLASIGPDYTALGRLAASNAKAVLDGKDAGTVPFSKPSGAQVVADAKTEAELGITISSAALPSSQPTK